jgi:Post-segregation antitoxin (ccd killing mechanism protein) encoded by the F plasmid
MSLLYNANAPKKPTNLTINSDLLTQAKEMKINLSATLENALADALKAKKREIWIEENKEAINAYNENVSEYGLFSDGIRMF